jgi:hypothetical protein
MEVAHIEQILFLFVNPHFFSESLTLWAVSVSARIIGILQEVAVVTDISVAAHSRGSAVEYVPKHFCLMPPYITRLEKVLFVQLKNILYLNHSEKSSAFNIGSISAGLVTPLVVLAK